MNIHARILLILCLFFGAFESRAALVSRLFEVSLPVINQERDIRQAAFEQGFVEVLVRVSGNSQTPAQVDISRAASFVQQYRYLALEQPVTPAEGASTAEAPLAKHTLWIQYNEAAITRLLSDSNLPVWGKQRPNVLIWLAVRDGRNRYVLKDTDNSVIKEMVNREASRRGLPLIWPRYDNRDQQALGFADIWGGFWDPVVQASRRYAADGILLGRMDWTGSNWQITWSSRLEQTSEQWSAQSVQLDMLLASGIDVATDHIANRFAVLANTADADTLNLYVNGIQQVSSYARIARYLQSLVPVKHVVVTEVEKDHVIFNLAIAGDRDDFQRLVALDKTLVPDTAPVTNPVVTNPQPDATQQPAAAINMLYYKLNR